MHVIAPHVLDCPEHGAAGDLLGGDLVDDGRGHIRGLALQLTRPVEPRHTVNHDPHQGQVEVGHPGPAVSVPVPGVSVVAAQQVPHQADALPMHVTVLLVHGVVEVSQTEAHQEVLPPEL